MNTHCTETKSLKRHQNVNRSIRPFYSKNVFQKNTPPANIKKLEDEFFIQLAIPGFSKDDISINLEANSLTISSKKEAQDSDFKRLEFNYDSFSRKFQLSNDIDTDNIQANVDKGILTISLKIKESSKPRHISIH